MKPIYRPVFHVILMSVAIWAALFALVSMAFGQKINPGFYPRAGSVAGPTDDGTSGEFLRTAGDGTADWGTLDIGDAIGSATAGSVLFVGAGPVLSQDNAGLFFDATNNWLGIGDATPDGDVDVLSGGTNVAFALASASGNAVGLYAGTSGSFFQYDDSGTFGIRATPNASIQAGTYGGTTQVNIKTEVGGETALGLMNSNSGSWTGAAVYCDTSQRVGFGKTASLTAQVNVKSAETDRVGLIVTPQVSSTVDTFQVHDSAGTRVFGVDDDGNTVSTGNIGIGESDPDTKAHIAGAITAQELSADPSDPDEGDWVIWMSDGTGSGDDGDVMVKVTAGATTKTITLIDFSAF